MVKTTAEKIKVMQAYDNDYEIEACALDADVWFPCPNPNWNWGMFDFRIKKESTKRPMTYDEIVEYWREHRTEIFYYTEDDDHECFMISGFGMNIKDSTEKYIYFNEGLLDYESFIKHAVKEDGTKFEVEC